MEYIIVITLIVCLLLCWIIYTQKARFTVRKFFQKAISAEILYQLFKKAKYDNDFEQTSFKIQISYEDVQDICIEVTGTIKYYEDNRLGDFEEETLEKTYEDLLMMASQLRHWLWVNKDEQES